MTTTRLAWTLAAAAAAFSGCTKTEKTSPYPARTVSGTVSDVRTGAVLGARVLVWNDFDTGSATTAADGSFTLTVDGSDVASYWRVTKADLRTREGNVAVGAAGATLPVSVLSKDEILFGNAAGDVYMVRATAGPFFGAFTAIVTTADFEATPCFATNDGLTIRWANTTAGQVIEAAWDGTNAHAIYTIPAGYTLGAIACAERGTLVERTQVADSSWDVVIAESPSGTDGLSYVWPGWTPSFSPSAFGSLGPRPIGGNMAAFAEGDGIYTAFPYFDSSFLVPEKVPGTQALDDFPRWSPYREDGTLHLGLKRNYRVYLSGVTVVNHQNVFSSPAGLFGNSGAEPHVTDFAWAPGIAGQDDRIVVVDHPLFYTGDLVVVGFDPATRAITSGPTVVYDANAQGSVGKALRVGWR